MSMSKYSLGLALLVCISGLQAAGVPKGGSGSFFCCEGGRVCGDTLPDQCRGKAYRILDSSGNTIKEVGPPLTQEQKAQIAAEAQRKKELEEQLKEQRRKDQALLVTYATPQDIDMAQNKAEEDVNFAIRAAEEKIAAAQKRRKKMEEEAEFYKKKKNLPPALAKDIRDVDHEIKTEQELLEVKRSDAATIKAKYDADRKRYGELTGRYSTPATSSASAPGTKAAPR